MTEEKNKPESDEKCCSDKSGKGCGSGCGSSYGCKCFKAFMLILLGFIAGYFLTGRCHSAKKMMCCNGPQMSTMKCPVSGTMATPPAEK